MKWARVPWYRDQDIRFDVALTVVALVLFVLALVFG